VFSWSHERSCVESQYGKLFEIGFEARARPISLIGIEATAITCEIWLSESFFISGQRKSKHFKLILSARSKKKSLKSSLCDGYLKK
jgi:hypothetical protein